MSSVYRKRQLHFRKYFHLDEELSLVYSSSVNGLIDKFKSGVYKDVEVSHRLF